MGALKVRVGGAWVTIPGYGNTVGVPADGVLGDLLIKNSATAGDARWGINPPKLVLGGESTSFPTALTLNDATHATSRRATLALGSGWQLMQDFNATGTKDFMIYQVANGRAALWIDASGQTTTFLGGLKLGGPSNAAAITCGGYLQFIGNKDIYLDGDVIYLRGSAGSGNDRGYIANKMWNVSGQVRSAHDTAGFTWDQAQFLSYPVANGNAQSRICLHSPGAAPQLCAAGVDGEKVKVVNSTITGYVPILASAFTVSSSATLKRGVRLLREGEHVPVAHDPRSDEVPDIDVMSLRPVAFRPKVGALRIVPLAGDDKYTPERHRIVPQVGILGHEGERERLGLIAEHVETVLPSAVEHDRDGNALGIDYAQITVALLDHVQRLTLRVAELEGAA